MFKVFIPTDFSRNATNAIKYALNFCKKLDAKFILFHGGILPIPVGEMPIVTSVLDGAEIKAHLKADILKQAADVKFKLNEKRIAYLATEDFSLPPMITQNALKVKADLIIMGTRGASGIKKAFIGSNAVDVISRSHIPVLSVPNNYEYTGIKKILMPSDLKNLTGELREALPFAKLFNAQLQILFISDASEEGMKRYDAAAKSVKRNSYKKIKLIIEGVKFGDSIAKDIASAVKNTNPDLLIMFRHEHNWIGNLFITSQTDQLAFASKVPLLALREPK